MRHFRHSADVQQPRSFSSRLPACSPAPVVDTEQDDLSTVYQRYTCLMATSTTTVKVQTSTRDLLRSIGAARHQTADQVILSAIAALTRVERRQIAAAEARAIADDPVDRAEIRAIQDDIAALREG